MGAATGAAQAVNMRRRAGIEKQVFELQLALASTPVVAQATLRASARMLQVGGAPTCSCVPRCAVAVALVCATLTRGVM